MKTIAIALAVAVVFISLSGTIKAIDDKRAEKIDAYFEARNMPLAGYGEIFVENADIYGLDWRILPAIAVIESTGGKYIPKNSFNAWGWKSGAHSFKSFEHGIEYIISRFGKSYLYKGKTTKQVLNTYNPPSIRPGYAKDVMAVMNKISTDR